MGKGMNGSDLDDGSAMRRWAVGIPRLLFGAPGLFVSLCVLGLLARWVLMPPPPGAGTLVLWSSAYPHLEAYETVLDAFESSHGVEVEIQSMPFGVIDQRLQSAFWSGRGMPDVVELPQEKLGVFLVNEARAGLFVDLSERASSIGPGGVPLEADFIASRLDLYRDRGRLIGLPHDVHPVMLAYRWRDFEAAGIDAGSIRTWEDFLEAGKLLTRSETGPGRRFMLSVDERTPIVFQSMLLQRGGNWFDESGSSLIADPLTVDTLVAYTEMVHGPGRIADTIAAFPSPGFYRALAEGYYVCFICPDWLTRNIEVNLPAMAGEFRLMPLPAWEEGGPRTSTWGATMLGITASCDSPDLAWELVRFLYASETVSRVSYEQTNIVTPLRSLRSMTVFDEPRAYWGGQAIGRLYLDLADETPVLRNGPFPRLLLKRIADVLVACGERARASGTDGLRAFCRSELLEAESDMLDLLDRLAPSRAGADGSGPG
jgi:arabinosaccharide transport system substrate-binding protein